MTSVKRLILFLELVAESELRNSMGSFTCKVPLEPSVADAGDLGIPAVLSHPNSVSATEFVRIAEQVVCSLSVLSSNNEQVLSNYNYEWSDL